MIPFPIQNTSLTKTTLQTPTSIPWENNLHGLRSKYKELLQVQLTLKPQLT
jgi:hypothetical protein